MIRVKHLTAIGAATGVGLCVACGLHAADASEAEQRDAQNGAVAVQQEQQQEFGMRQQVQTQREMKIYEVSELHGMRVESRDGEQIGSIDSLAVDLQSQSPSFIVVESGGLLGIGADLKVVPFEAVEVVQTEGMIGERQTLRVDIDEAQWEEIPSYEQEQILQLCQIDQAREVYQHFNIEMDEERSREFGARQETQEEVRSEEQSEAEYGVREQREVTQEQTQCKLVLTRELEGLAIHDSQRAEVGSVKDMVVDLGSGTVQYVLISPETGFFERTEESFAVSPGSFSTITTEEVVINISREQFQQAEALTQTTIREHSREEGTLREEARVYRYERDQIEFGAPDRSDADEEEDRSERTEEERDTEERSSEHARPGQEADDVETQEQEFGRRPAIGEDEQRGIEEEERDTDQDRGSPPAHTPPHAGERGTPPHAGERGTPPHARPGQEADDTDTQEQEFGRRPAADEDEQRDTGQDRATPPAHAGERETPPHAQSERDADRGTDQQEFGQPQGRQQVEDADDADEDEQDDARSRGVERR